MLIALHAGVSAALPAAMVLRRTLRFQETGAGVPVDLGLCLTGASLVVLWTLAPWATALAAGPLGLVYVALWVPILRHRSHLDAKTGLFNLPRLRSRLDREIEHARRDAAPLAVVMLDLDHLRLVNNRFGVAAALSRAAGTRGFAGRFGGEEFCLVLPGCDADEAIARAEQVRVEVDSMPFAGGPEVHTISAGVATFPGHGIDADALLAAADSALYDAKLGGRNRVRLALPEGAQATERALADLATLPPRHRAEETLAATAADLAEPAPEPSRDRRVAILAAAVTAGAALVGLVSPTGAIAGQPVLFVLLIAAVLVCDALRIEVFERLRSSPAALPVLALAAVFGPLGPIAGEAAIAAVRALRRHPVMVFGFDFGALALAGSAAALVFELFPASGADLLGVGALAGLAYYAVNMPLLSCVISLTRGGSPLANFREQLAWLLPHYLAFGTLGAVFVLAEQRMALNAFLLFGLPTAILWVAEKQYLQRSRAGVTELRRQKGELEVANDRLMELLGTNQALLDRLQQSYLSTITSLARTIEAKDPYTGGHTERVAHVASDLAEALGFEGESLRAIQVGAVIHDIGKIGVSDSTLLKAGPLTPAERSEIERHPEISSYILAELDFPPIVKQMVRSHHERFDGTGYPDALQGEEIPLPARILSVADALDAMTSDRPYRKALSMRDALRTIEEDAGTHFCPRVVAALQRCLAHETEASPPVRVAAAA